MSLHQLKALLDDVPDTRELVLLRQLEPEPDAVLVAWRDAHEEAHRAYRRWRSAGGSVAYAVYRAAQDREDAAQAILAVA